MIIAAHPITHMGCSWQAIYTIQIAYVRMTQQHVVRLCCSATLCVSTGDSDVRTLVEETRD